MGPSGEHFSPLKTDRTEIDLNVDRYLFALKYLEGKTVIDLGCGAGLGTYFYSMLAKKVYAVDYSIEAIESTRHFPFPTDRVEFLHLDITDPKDRQKLPTADVCVALEVLEHVENPAAVLADLKVNQLVFSVPLYSMEVSTWHRYAINSEADVRKLISPYFQIGLYEEQTHKLSNGRWIRGEGVRLLQ